MNLDELSPALRSHVRKWRWFVFSSMFVGWSCLMLVRRTLPSSTSSLILHQGFSREEVGLIASSFASAYGVSKFLGAIICDHASPGKVFACGLLLSGACSVIFPNAWLVSLACAVWFIQGMVQGLGWPPCVILLKKWYPPSQIGRWWSILSSAGNITGALIPFIVLYLTSLVDWKFSFYLFGAVSLVTGMVVLFSVKDSPSDAIAMVTSETRGTNYLSDRLSNKDDKSTTTSKPSTIAGNAEKKISPENQDRSKPVENAVQKKGRWYSAFFVPNLWVVSVVYVLLYLVNSSSQNWSQLYFVQEVGMSEASAATCYSMFQVGAIAGNFVSGFISDLFITPRTQKSPCPRAPFLFGVSVLLTVFIHLWRTTVVAGASEAWSSAVMFGIGFLAYSGVAVVGLCAMDVVESHLVGSAHGLACAVAQVGSFVAGWPFSLMIKKYDWATAYLWMELSLVVMVALCLYLVFLLVRHLRKEKED